MNRTLRKVSRCNQRQRCGTALVIAIIALILCTSLSYAMVQTTILRQQRFVQRKNTLQSQLIAEAAVDRIKAEKLDEEPSQSDEWEVDIEGEKGLVTTTFTQTKNETHAKVVAKYPVQEDQFYGISSSIVVPLGSVESQPQSESQSKESM
ncbi:hypothetical protein AB1L42_10910 [Thalassoglobus sp. JC818]|uniref:hypothetical protein n=1 Tax=Thalassoglobus sp. JC818 TaxID=3232136 RepID=UPI003457BC45